MVYLIDYNIKKEITMEKYIINEELVLNNLSDIEYDFHEFLNELPIHSLQRWLLTLSLEEITNVRNEWEKILNSENSDVVDKFPVLIAMKRGYKNFDLEMHEKIFNEISVAISLIHMVKLGLLEYKMEEDDADWSFKPTEELKKQMNNYKP